MNLTEFSIRHNIAVLVMCLGVLAVGSWCYFALPRESFPDVEFPLIIVRTFLDGATPTDVEESVTVPLETELDGLEGLKEMRSASADSMSMISLEFDPGVNIETALNRVRDAVDQAKPDLPADADEPVVKEFTLTSVPILIYHIVGGAMVSISELDDLAETLEDDIKSVAGVLDVDVFGGRNREVVIEVNPDRLHFYELSLSQVRQVLEGTNRNVSAGVAESKAMRLVMRLPGEFESPADILDLVIGNTPDNTPVFLHDVATVRYDFEDEETRARLYDFAAGGDGSGTAQAPEKSVSLNIKKRTGANVVQLVAEVDRLLARRPLPPDVQIIKGLDHSKYVRMMVADLENGIGTALILVLAVIFVGLGARNALLVAAAIPFSLLISFIVLLLAGQTLNIIVLFSLILALGMLVDNAIVIIENIYRHNSMGVPRVKAAIIGTQEVAWPVITSTATTVGAFFPLLFWPGIMGEFMSYLPRTVIVVLLSSLFVALVINPTLAAMLIKLKPGARRAVDPETRRPNYWLVCRYQQILEFLLARPAWTVITAGSMLLFVFGAYARFNVGKELFPPTDPDNVTCSIKPPEGISLERSDALAKDLEARLFGLPGSGYDQPVANLKFANVVVGLEGVGDSGFSEENVGPVQINIEFVDREFRAEPTPQTINEMRSRVEGLGKQGERVTYPLFGADFDVIVPENGPPTGKPVAVDIFGQDLYQMARVIREMKLLMRNVPGTVKPTDDAATAQPTLEWKVDQAYAGVLGVDQATVGAVLQMAVGGLKVGTFGHGDDEQDIVLRFPADYRLNTDRLKNVTIPLADGGIVPLSSVTSVNLVPGPVTIKHFNKKRVLNAAAEVQPGLRNEADIRGQFQQAVAQYPFPPNISYRFGGAAEEEEAASRFLSKAFVVAIFVILLVMVLQFNSVSIAGIVMCSVILSLMGVFSGLLILRAPFGIIMTGVGVISLAGVVVNNAIVLLDAIHQHEERGEATLDAIITASMIRFRPVLLTAITTILGLVPMALKLNIDFRNLAFQYDTSSAQWWQSMAVAVIFGLLIATVLTLGVVPTLYLLYARARERLLQRA
jgi:multidrug efflux pump